MQPAPIPGIGQSAGFTFQIEQRNTTDDVHAFEKVVKKFVAEANKNPAISRAVSYYSAHTPSYNLTVDREKCKKMGVSISDVFTTIQVIHGQFICERFHTLQPNFPRGHSGRYHLSQAGNDMDKYYVRNQSGEMLPLSSLIIISH